MAKNKSLSIIMNAFNQNKAQTHMTITALDAIRRFTDTDYELILIDNVPAFGFYDPYKTIQLDHHVVNDPDPGCYASFNQGAKLAKGDYLAFIQNDVYVTERCIDNMRYYLDNDIVDVVFPDQAPRTREYIKRSYELDFEDPEVMKSGSRDAGLMMMPREIYEKSGGWPEEIKSAIIGETIYYDTLFKKNSFRWVSTRKAQILHIMAATNLAKDRDVYNKTMEEEANLIQQAKEKL